MEPLDTKNPSKQPKIGGVFLTIALTHSLSMAQAAAQPQISGLAGHKVFASPEEVFAAIPSGIEFRKRFDSDTSQEIFYVSTNYISPQYGVPASIQLKFLKRPSGTGLVEFETRLHSSKSCAQKNQNCKSGSNFGMYDEDVGEPLLRRVHERQTMLFGPPASPADDFGSAMYCNDFAAVYVSVGRAREYRLMDISIRYHYATSPGQLHPRSCWVAGPSKRVAQ